MSDEQLEIVLHLVSVGDWSSAIQTYQEETGADREMAIESIERLAGRHGFRRPSRSYYLLAALTAVVLIFAVVWTVQV